MADDFGRAPVILVDGREARIVACSLCGGVQARTLFVRHGFRYEACGNCGLVRVNPQLTQQAIADIYRHGYEAKSANTAPVDAPLSAAERGILDALAHYAGSAGRLLDVGCFQGRFLHAAARSGWQATGTEIARDAADYARKNRGLDVRLGPLEEIRFADGSFDAVVLLDVIEHVPDPRRTMEEVRRVLRPGGIAYLWTPNFDCITRRIARGHWGAVVFPWHLHYFNAHTLGRLATVAGFAPVSAASRNWLLDFRDRYAALKKGSTLGNPPRAVRRVRRALDAASAPIFSWADARGRSWGAQMELYARRVDR
jgi:2-polyprenyl-3-methyl-5-hydroxy-6-metoxy-1,4-benzoquinol methylase